MEFFFFFFGFILQFSILFCNFACVKAPEWIWKLRLNCRYEVTVGIIVQGGAAETLLEVALQEEEGGGRRAMCHQTGAATHSTHSIHSTLSHPPFLFLSFQFIWGAALSLSLQPCSGALVTQEMLWLPRRCSTCILSADSLMAIFRPTFLLHVADIKTHCCVFSHTLSVDYMRDFCLGWKMIVCVVHGNTLLTYDYDKTNGFWPQLLILII